MYKILAIAGVDPSGGAGIAADLKTIGAHGAYGMCAITALTVQNTVGVYGVSPVAPEFVSEQILRVFEDIRPDAVKVGMTGDAAVSAAVGAALKQARATRVVCDPVMVATSGGRLDGGISADVLCESLLKYADVVTPNIPEAEVLSGIKIACMDDILRAAEIISKKLQKSAVLIKGGHFEKGGDCTDTLLENGVITRISGVRVESSSTHGTGCTLSSAIACNLCKMNLVESITAAKRYVEGAIAAAENIGQGHGPLDHFFNVTYN